MLLQLDYHRWQDIDVGNALGIEIELRSRLKREPRWLMRVSDVQGSTIYYRIHSDYIESVELCINAVAASQVPAEESEVGG